MRTRRGVIIRATAISRYAAKFPSSHSSLPGAKLRVSSGRCSLQGAQDQREYVPSCGWSGGLDRPGYEF